jgi:hypothetical protein
MMLLAMSSPNSVVIVSRMNFEPSTVSVPSIFRGLPHDGHDALHCLQSRSCR